MKTKYLALGIMNALVTDMKTYMLPDGRRVEVHDDIARDADYITFTLKGGKIVVAIKVK